MPGSLTSSINSSESEQGVAANAAAAGGGRRAASAGAANGQRSVYLHAAAVADIPSSEGRPVQVGCWLKQFKAVTPCSRFPHGKSRTNHPKLDKASRRKTQSPFCAKENLSEDILDFTKYSSNVIPELLYFRRVMRRGFNKRLKLANVSEQTVVKKFMGPS